VAAAGLSDLIAKGWDALARAAGLGSAAARGRSQSSARAPSSDRAQVDFAARIDAARDRLRSTVAPPSDSQD
jgi:hypothetical protein